MKHKRAPPFQPHVGYHIEHNAQILSILQNLLGVGFFAGQEGIDLDRGGGVMGDAPPVMINQHA